MPLPSKNAVHNLQTGAAAGFDNIHACATSTETLAFVFYGDGYLAESVLAN